MFATSQDKLRQKLCKLKQCADSLKMILHPTKSQFITTTVGEPDFIQIDDIVIKKAAEYIYLGTPISCQPLVTQIRNHIKSKMPHTYKFTSFLYKNSDCPYTVKKKVWRSALLASLFYSSETWLTSDLRPADSPYNSMLRQLLSVRNTTCKDLMYLETGLSDAKHFILEKQIKFVHKMRARDRDHYVNRIMDMSIEVKSPMGRRLHAISNMRPDQQNLFLESVKNTVMLSDSSRRTTYKQINPELRPCVFLQNQDLPEQDRISVTRLRLASHYLKVETGRWSRIPYELRTCSCGNMVQTEEHVLLSCPLTANLRLNYNLEQPTNLQELFDFPEQKLIAEYCKTVLNYYRT